MPTPAAPHLARLIPNAITVTALCTGLSAIRFALAERWEWAVSLILIAAVLDAMDGRIARLLRVASTFGAELDSLSDFISFGIAPAVVLYLYSLQTWEGTGWAFTLFFSTCMALRLARFNTNMDASQPEWTKTFSVGVPAPAGAILALLPLMVGFALEMNFRNSPLLFSCSLTLTGLLMISRIPTYGLKKVRIPLSLIRPFLITVAVVMAALFSIPWWTLSIGTFLYILSIPLSVGAYKKRKGEMA